MTRAANFSLLSRTGILRGALVAEPSIRREKHYENINILLPNHPVTRDEPTKLTLKGQLKDKIVQRLLVQGAASGRGVFGIFVQYNTIIHWFRRSLESTLGREEESVGPVEALVRGNATVHKCATRDVVADTVTRVGRCNADIVVALSHNKCNGNAAFWTNATLVV